MTFGSIVGWIACGLLVGIAARILVPGRQEMGLAMTTVLGVGGALAGGAIYSRILGTAVEPFSLASHNWYGWIVAILGATLLLWVTASVSERRW